MQDALNEAFNQTNFIGLKVYRIGCRGIHDDIKNYNKINGIVKPFVQFQDGTFNTMATNDKTNKLMFADDIHFTEYYNKLIAEKMCELMVDMNSLCV